MVQHVKPCLCILSIFFHRDKSKMFLWSTVYRVTIFIVQYYIAYKINAVMERTITVGSNASASFTATSFASPYFKDSIVITSPVAARLASGDNAEIRLNQIPYALAGSLFQGSVRIRSQAAREFTRLRFPATIDSCFTDRRRMTNLLAHYNWRASSSRSCFNAHKTMKEAFSLLRISICTPAFFWASS